MSATIVFPFDFQVTRQDESGVVLEMKAVFTPIFLALTTEQQALQLEAVAAVAQATPGRDQVQDVKLNFALHIAAELRRGAFGSDRLPEGIQIQLD